MCPINNFYAIVARQAGAQVSPDKDMLTEARFFS